MNQSGVLSREEPYSFVAAATINVGASTTAVYGPLANPPNKPVDALFLNAAAAQTLQFQDQNNQAVTMTFATAGTYIVPISPSSIQTTGTTVTGILVMYK